MFDLEFYYVLSHQRLYVGCATTTLKTLLYQRSQHFHETNTREDNHVTH